MKTEQTFPAGLRPHLLRRVAAEFAGTCMLVAVVVGSGIAAQQLSVGNVGLQLLENSIATALGLAVLILIFGPVSGAHLNPIVSIADWIIGRANRDGLPARDLAPYFLAQIAGGVVGTLLAGVMFDRAPVLSTNDRVTFGHLVAEVVATAVLVLLIFALARSGRGALTAAAVGAYIGAAYWFTSSTSFANPAVTIARMFTDTFAGIAPESVAPFILMQIFGGALGIVLVFVFYPTVTLPVNDESCPPPIRAKS